MSFPLFSINSIISFEVREFVGKQKMPYMEYSHTIYILYRNLLEFPSIFFDVILEEKQKQNHNIHLNDFSDSTVGNDFGIK